MANNSMELATVLIEEILKNHPTLRPRLSNRAYSVRSQASSTMEDSVGSRSGIFSDHSFHTDQSLEDLADPPMEDQKLDELVDVKRALDHVNRIEKLMSDSLHRKTSRTGSGSSLDQIKERERPYSDQDGHLKPPLQNLNQSTRSSVVKRTAAIERLEQLLSTNPIKRSGSLNLETPKQPVESVVPAINVKVEKSPNVIDSALSSQSDSELPIEGIDEMEKLLNGMRVHRPKENRPRRDRSHRSANSNSSRITQSPQTISSADSIISQSAMPRLPTPQLPSPQVHKTSKPSSLRSDNGSPDTINMTKDLAISDDTIKDLPITHDIASLKKDSTGRQHATTQKESSHIQDKSILQKDSQHSNRAPPPLPLPNPSIPPPPGAPPLPLPSVMGIDENEQGDEDTPKIRARAKLHWKEIRNVEGSVWDEVSSERPAVKLDILKFEGISSLF